MFSICYMPLCIHARMNRFSLIQQRNSDYWFLSVKFSTIHQSGRTECVRAYVRSSNFVPVFLSRHHFHIYYAWSAFECVAFQQIKHNSVYLSSSSSYPQERRIRSELNALAFYALRWAWCVQKMRQVFLTAARHLTFNAFSVLHLLRVIFLFTFLSLLATYIFLVLDVFIISVFRWPLCSQRHSIGNGIGASWVREHCELLRHSKN